MVYELYLNWKGNDSLGSGDKNHLCFTRWAQNLKLQTLLSPKTATLLEITKGVWIWERKYFLTSDFNQNKQKLASIQSSEVHKAHPWENGALGNKAGVLHGWSIGYKCVWGGGVGNTWGKTWKWVNGLSWKDKEFRFFFNIDQVVPKTSIT